MSGLLREKKNCENENKKGAFFRKAQITIEFFIVFTIMILLFVFFAIIFLNKFFVLENKATYFSAEEICETVSYSIDRIYFLPDGSYTSLYLPLTLKNGQNYSVYFYAKGTVVSYGQREEFCPIVTLDVYGNMSAGAWSKIIRKEKGVFIEN